MGNAEYMGSLVLIPNLSRPSQGMAHILSVLLALAPVQAQMLDAVKHVKEGQEYLSNSPGQQQEVREDNIFSDAVPTDKFSVCKDPSEARQSFYDFSSEDIEKLRNVSYTPQYYSLNALTEKYAKRPFNILGFPCNQFLRQEPGANASEIYAVIKHVRPGDGFVPNFEMFAKSEVNGENENPIYTFLKSRCPSVKKEFSDPYKLYYKPYHADDIRWNFEKFLLNEAGVPVRRYDESLDPLDIVPDIDALLERIE